MERVFIYKSKCYIKTNLFSTESRPDAFHFRYKFYENIRRYKKIELTHLYLSDAGAVFIYD